MKKMIKLIIAVILAGTVLLSGCNIENVPEISAEQEMETELFSPNVLSAVTGTSSLYQLTLYHETGDTEILTIDSFSYISNSEVYKFHVIEDGNTEDVYYISVSPGTDFSIKKIK